MVNSGEDPRHPAGQQLLHRELGRAVQPAFALLAVGQLPGGREAGEMDLGAGRGLQDRRLDLDEAFGREPLPQRRLYPGAHLEVRQAPREPVGTPFVHAPPSHAGGAACRVRS